MKLLASNLWCLVTYSFGFPKVWFKQLIILHFVEHNNLDKLKAGNLSQ